MRIALIGYGKMGRAVEAEAMKRGHETGLTIDTPEEWQEKEKLLGNCDVAIEFSTPATAVDNIKRCLSAGMAVVSGTTGWTEHLEEVKAECERCEGALFVASNFSIGMNIVFELNRRMARFSERFGGYKASIRETHHIHKLDAPSGTAIHLADDMIKVGEGESWQLVRNWDEPTGEGVIAIEAVREGEVAGIHEVRYDSEVDRIGLVHEAKSRAGLAQGAVMAAEYLQGRKGFYTMGDMLFEGR